MTTVAPYFDLDRACWVPAVRAWDAATGELRRVEGPEGFASDRQVIEGRAVPRADWGVEERARTREQEGGA
jgi:hypothetical protein